MSDIDSRLVNEAFIKSASIHILASLIKHDPSGQNLSKKAANLAFELNDELQKRFAQK